MLLQIYTVACDGDSLYSVTANESIENPAESVNHEQ